jgi:polyisoprenoid-binding protein YceI
MLRSLRFSTLAALVAAASLTACGDVGDAPEATTTAVATTEEVAFTGTAIPIASTDSTVTWIGAKLTGNHLGGFRETDGVVYVDGDAVTGADVRIDMTSIYSDNDDLTGHLMSEDFFEVQTYPEARFRTTAIRPITEADEVQSETATHMVTGLLTMRDQTNEVTFPAYIAQTDAGATVQASFIIDRTNWGITYPGMQDDLINDQVRIDLDVATSDAAAEAAPDAAAV